MITNSIEGLREEDWSTHTGRGAMIMMPHTHTRRSVTAERGRRQEGEIREREEIPGESRDKGRK